MADGTVEGFLHDAEHALSGAMMAGIMRHVAAEKEFRAKAVALVREALTLDPKRADDAWRWVDGGIRRLADAEAQP